MREQLIQYVNLLFAGAPDADEIRAEILQNTLDRYDDLVAQGKAPEAAYRLAITGIGDINEILGSASPSGQTPVNNQPAPAAQAKNDTPENKKMRAIAVAMYIMCPIPLFILSEFGLSTLGLCLTIGLVAAATYAMIKYSKPDDEDDADEDTKSRQVEMEVSAQLKLKKSVSSLIWAIGLAGYFILSFATGAWYITWLMFPIIGCVEGLVKAIMDLKEASNHET